MASASKTVNPLHFEDLEPHRFEDLVRQLVYDYRPWSSIEAVGRLGSDEGIDIRASERIITDVLDDEAEDAEIIQAAAERTWIIQCKRERAITPAKITAIVTNDLTRQSEPPYAYVLAAACDFSKKTRDTFRQAVLSLGVQEFHLWGKADLEDKLFQPKNDHLLFAYFGISLQIRRRSLKTDVRARLALKRKLVKELGGLHEFSHATVLIRDVRDDTYPFFQEKESAEDFMHHPRWRYWKFAGHHPNDSLMFVLRRHLAWVDWDMHKWDALYQYDEAYPYHPELYGVDFAALDKLPWLDRRRYHEFWDTHVPTANKAHLEERVMVPYERIIALDELGDAVHTGPHLLIEYRADGSPFEERYIPVLEPDNHYDNRRLRAEPADRATFFPKVIPDPPSPTPVDFSEAPQPPSSR